MNRTLILSIAVVVFSASFVSADLAGNALVFDGLDDFVRIPDAAHLDGMSAMTMELWFYPFDVDRDNPLISKSDGSTVYSDRSYELSRNSKFPHAAAPHSASFFSGSSGWTWLQSDAPPLVSNQWVHMAATYDSINGIANLYVNGIVSVTSHFQADDVSPILEPIRNSQQDVFLGAMFEIVGNSYFSYGIMDEVRIWDVARSESQISQNFNKLVNSTENGLIGYWNFDESLGTQVIDSSPFHNNGIISGALRTTSTAPIVPEPATLLLLSLGGLLIKKR